MKVFVVIAVSLAALTGCTRVVEVEVPSQTTQEIVVPENPSDYDLFIESVHRLSNYPIYVPDSDLWAAGVDVCDFLASGGTSLGLATLAAETLGDDDVSIDIFVSLVAAAVSVICPEYEYKINDYAI